MVTVLICGEVPPHVIDFINAKYKIARIIHNGVRCGTVSKWITDKKVEVVTVPLDQYKYKDKAVFVQYMKMLRTEPDLVLVHEHAGLLGKFVDSAAKDMKLPCLVVK